MKHLINVTTFKRKTLIFIESEVILLLTMNREDLK